jgi:hypothetical protein
MSPPDSRAFGDRLVRAARPVDVVALRVGIAATVPGPAGPWCVVAGRVVAASLIGARRAIVTERVPLGLAERLTFEIVGCLAPMRRTRSARHHRAVGATATRWTRPPPRDRTWAWFTGVRVWFLVHGRISVRPGRGTCCRSALVTATGWMWSSSWWWAAYLGRSAGSAAWSAARLASARRPHPAA